MKYIFPFILTFVISIFFLSCKKTPNSSYYDSVTCSDPDDSLNTYSKKIGAIFNSSCARSGCHDSGTHKGKVDLEGYDNEVATFNKKHVLCAIYQNKGCKPMPKGGGKLSDDV